MLQFKEPAKLPCEVYENSAVPLGLSFVSEHSLVLP